MTVARDSTYNLLGAVLPVAVSLLTVPIYLSVIGAERFGVLALAWLFLGYFGVVRPRSRQGHRPEDRLARPYPADRSRIFWGAMAVNTAAGIIGGLILYIAAHLRFSRTISKCRLRSGRKCSRQYGFSRSRFRSRRSAAWLEAR